jgi:hypothetical protein
MSEMDQKEVARNLAMVQMNSKNTGMAALLVLFFGGLGFFYVSILGGIITVIIEIVLWILTFFTFGFGIIFVIIYHILLVILAIILVKSHNKTLLTKTFEK